LTNADETITDNYLYDAFGNLLASSGSSGNTYAFTGERWDGSTGLLYLRARYYDPEVGRFVGRDPIESVNPYVYCENNPVDFVDPSGLYWEYCQNTGDLTYVDPEDGERTFKGSGYSGAPGFVNDSDSQSFPYAGPIPQGIYDIGLAYTHPRLKGFTMNLEPRSGTDTFGRDLFRIHGDNSEKNQSASEGCVVLSLKIRKQINQSKDREFRVVTCQICPK
jgi:RHS repeat-associated protein